MVFFSSRSPLYSNAAPSGTTTMTSPSSNVFFGTTSTTSSANNVHTDTTSTSTTSPTSNVHIGTTSTTSPANFVPGTTSMTSKSYQIDFIPILMGLIAGTTLIVVMC
jgi:hypothetical protein